jgi:5-methylcytosine-specific restriction endonuclease McrA
MLVGDAKRKYAREWVAGRRKNFFSTQVCSHCAGTEKLELHHLNRTDKIANAIWSWSESRRNEELKKCIVLCKNCHQIETNKQIKEWTTKPIPHGNQSGYRRGCRCDLCRAGYKTARRIHFLKTGN